MKRAYISLVAIIMVSLFTPVSVFSENKNSGSSDVIADLPEPLDTFQLPEICKVTADSEPHYIRITVVLGYARSTALAKELERRRDEIFHIINILLEGKKYEDLDTVSGIMELAEEIKAHVNIRLTSGMIKEIYFKEFIVN